MRLCERCLKNEAIYDGYCEECYTTTKNAVSNEYSRKMMEVARLAEIGKEVTTFIQVEEWHEELGCCLFWRLPIEEEPMVTGPLSSDWIEDYFTHFTLLNKAVDAIEEAYRQSQKVGKV